ncbi:putative ribonuclease H-like domain-containing protein [Tanacetum coccineum]
MYCLVVTDDYSRFSWVFFIATKDETSGILKSFITGVENLIDQRVKIIRCDNGTKLKNKEMNQFYEIKGIKREFSIARTPQQNGVAEKKNRTLIEVARTMLADSKIPTTFWAEAVYIACYVQKPFGCPVTILNTIDHLGKFDGKADEGLFVGYSINSKAFRVFNSRTRIVEENLNVQFSENTPNIVGSGPNWLFDIDALTKSMNYKLVIAGNQSNGNEGTKLCDDAGIEVNAGDSKLMLLGINLLLLGKVNATRHNLLLLVAKTINGEQQLQALVDRKKIIITEATVRRDLQLEDADVIDYLPNATIFEQLTLMGKQRPRKPKRKDTKIPQSSVPIENVADEAVYKERDDSLERATTTATGLDAEHDIGNISKTQSKETPNDPSSIGTSSGSGPRRQDTMGDAISYTRSKNVSKFSNDPLLARVNTPRSGEDSLQLKELMEFCTKLQQRVLDLENTKTAQAQEITSLKKRVKKLERKKKSRTYGLKRLYKERKIHDIDADEDITLENVHDADMFGVHDLDGDEVFVETKEHVVNAATTTSTIPVSAAKDLSDVDMTLAQALAELKSTKTKADATTTTTAVTRPKDKGLVIQEQEQSSTPMTSSKDKGKGIMVEEPLEMKKKDQVIFDEQEVIRLQAQFDKEDRIARKKEEVNVALIAQWNDIQDKVETDYELAQRLQAEEQEDLTIKDKSKLFQQLLEKRRKHFVAKRAEERRNRPPTKAQQKEYNVYLSEKHSRMEAQRLED